MDYFAPERIQATRARLRKQTIRTILEEFDHGIMQLPLNQRLDKYRKMAETPFRFYRGAAYLFYYDVTALPFAYHTPSDKPTWIQGDLHFENFGGFRSERGDMVYDVNDFDEGYLGSYLYDLLRMSASIVLAAQQQKFTEEEQYEAVYSYLKAYYKQIERFATREEDPATLQFTEANTKGPIRKVLRKLNQRSSDHLLQGITAQVQDHRQFRFTDEIEPLNALEQAKLYKAWPEYLETLSGKAKQADSFYTIKDIAVKHGSGTASIGLDRFYALIEGDASDAEADDLILEIKEVRAPIPAYFLEHNPAFWEQFSHQGMRVVTTQKAMHHEVDPHLGFLTIDDRHFYIRERSPYKKRVKAAAIQEMKQLLSTVKTMGKITAKIHARADADMDERLLDYHSEDEILKAMGPDSMPFCRRVTLWALNYAKQVHVDYGIFCELVEDLQPHNAAERTIS